MPSLFIGDEMGRVFRQIVGWLTVFISLPWHESITQKGDSEALCENIAKGAAKAQTKSKMPNQSKFIADMTQVPKLASCKIGR